MSFLFQASGPLVGHVGVEVYNNTQTIKGGGVPTSNPLIFQPFLEAEKASAAIVGAIPPAIDNAVNDGVEIVGEVAHIVEEVAHDVGVLVGDAFQGLEWLFEHPFLVIGLSVGAIAAIAYAASTKTNISVAK